MSGGWRRKRFWKTASAAPHPEGWSVVLDDRPLRTPAKAALVVPTAPLAEAIAAEWQAQPEVIDPRSMPLTRAANVTIDKVVPMQPEVAREIAAWAETDLLCYRAADSAALAEIQARDWDPLLDWAGQSLGARLVVTRGIVPVDQPADALDRLAGHVAAQDGYALTALSDLVALSGSLVIGLAATAGVLPPEELWRRARLDETWQESHWGVDEEAAALAALKRADFLRAALFWQLSRPPA